MQGTEKESKFNHALYYYPKPGGALNVFYPQAIQDLADFDGWDDDKLIEKLNLNENYDLICGIYDEKKEKWVYKGKYFNYVKHERTERYIKND